MNSNFSLGMVNDIKIVYNNIVEFISQKNNILKEIKCPSIKLVYLEVINMLINQGKIFVEQKKISVEDYNNARAAFKEVIDFAKTQIYSILFSNTELRVNGGDFSESPFNVMLLKLY